MRPTSKAREGKGGSMLPRGTEGRGGKRDGTKRNFPQIQGE